MARVFKLEIFFLQEKNRVEENKTFFINPLQLVNQLESFLIKSSLHSK